MTNEEKILVILAVMQGEMTAMRGDMTAMQGEITKINIKIESGIEPKINALGEGQKSILEMLIPRSRVDDLEEELKLLKLVVRQMGEELQTLKRA